MINQTGEIKPQTHHQNQVKNLISRTQKYGKMREINKFYLWDFIFNYQPVYFNNYNQLHGEKKEKKRPVWHKERRF